MMITGDLGRSLYILSEVASNSRRGTIAPLGAVANARGNMKNSIGVVAVGAAMAIVALEGAGAASASVEGFLLEMDTPSATHQEQLLEGNSFCAALSSGRDQQLSGPAAAAIITDFSDYNASQGRAGVYGVRLIKTAVTELCPANRGFFMSAAQAYDAQEGE